MSERPLFSILHTSARPDKWRAVYDDWMSKAVHPEQVEYVLCVDERWGFKEGPCAAPWGNTADCIWCWHNQYSHTLVWNTHPYQFSGYVSGVNIAARASTGRILIVNADDQFACEGWDESLLSELKNAYPNTLAFNRDSSAERPDFVLEVSTGTPDEHKRGIMVMPILSRARYERLGYVFYPEYESMFADNDFCEHARQDGVVIDARHLMFPHRHVMVDGKGGWKPNVAFTDLDAPYQAQMRQGAWEISAPLLERRRAAHFGPVYSRESTAAVQSPPTSQSEAPAPAHRENKKRWTCSSCQYESAFFSPETFQASGIRQCPNCGADVAVQARRESIALCVPGEHFRGEVFDGILRLYGHLLMKFGEGGVAWMRNYTSNVYVTRAELLETLKRSEVKLDLVLWLDDDNVLTPEQFDRLYEDLKARPDLDGVTGWCWIHDDQVRSFKVSCGLWAPDHVAWQPFDPHFAHESELRDAEVTGFPAFLMRWSIIEKAGERPFIRGILDERLPHGIGGEDLAFCRAAEQGGAKFAADPRVRVEHLRYTSYEPRFEERDAQADVKVAAMLRVKNEGRWIRRVLESLKPLCGERIFVMDDGSTDNTFPEACAGLMNGFRDARLVNSPFAGQPLDERRDKSWMLEQVKQLWKPDWILCIDGDEELEPGGAEKILRALRSAPAVDCFALRVVFLWDRVDMLRIDGIYGQLARQSLFRPIEGMEFQCFYEGAGGDFHVGLHCSNAPAGMRVSNLNVFLLHYGYLFREDRLRKFAWYNQHDPNNQHEDQYRHMVIGDLPELSATMKTAKSGPLDLRKLPRHLVPQNWDDSIGPLEGPAPELPVIQPAIPVEPQGTGQRLNLGCCDRRIPGYVGVDIAPGPNVDVVADLRAQWPWPDDSVAEIKAHDIIEHLADKVFTMNELWRVLAPGGIAEICVPTTEGPGAFQDPTHTSFWNRRSFLYFEAGNIYRERFAKAYGITAAFDVLSERTEQTMDGPKLTIRLRAAQKTYSGPPREDRAVHSPKEAQASPAPVQSKDLEVALL